MYRSCCKHLRISFFSRISLFIVRFSLRFGRFQFNYYLPFVMRIHNFRIYRRKPKESIINSHRKCNDGTTRTTHYHLQSVKNEIQRENKNILRGEVNKWYVRMYDG